METAGIVKNDTIVSLEDFYNAANDGLKAYIVEETTEEGDIKTYRVNYGKVLSEDPSLNEKFQTEAGAFVAQQAVSAVVEDYMNETVKYSARLAAKDSYYENRSR